MLPYFAILIAFSSAPHVLQKAFGVTLGEPSGDLREIGYRPNEFGTGDSWVITNDAFFDRVTVEVSEYRSLIESIAAAKFYNDGDRNAKERACEADLETVATTIRSKYPTLRKAAWLKSEDGLGGMLGYYRKQVLEEPAPRAADPSPARVVSLTCIGPSALARGGKQDQRTSLFVIYSISEFERRPIEADFRARQQQRERVRARALGVDPNKL